MKVPAPGGLPEVGLPETKIYQVTAVRRVINGQGA